MVLAPQSYQEKEVTGSWGEEGVLVDDLVLVEALVQWERQGTWLDSGWPVLAGLRIRIPLFYEGMGYQDDCGYSRFD